MAEISPGAVNAQIPPWHSASAFRPAGNGREIRLGRQYPPAEQDFAGHSPDPGGTAEAGRDRDGIAEGQAGPQTEADTFVAKAKPTSEFFESMVANRGKVPLTAANIKQGAIQNLFEPGFLSVKDPHDTALAQAIINQLAPGNTPEELEHNKMVLTRGFQWLHSTADGYGLTLGPIMTTNTGPAVVASRVGGLSEGPSTQAVFQNALSPEQKTETTIPLVNQETGQVTPRTKGEVFDPYGNMLPGAGAGGGMAPTAGGGAGGPRTGRYPGGAGGTAAVGTSSLPVGGPRP